MSPLHVFFHWPEGGIWSNILASVIWTTPAFIAGQMVSHYKLKKHLTKHMDKLHEHIEKGKKYVK